MSRSILGNYIDVVACIPDSVVGFVLTDPPYLIGSRDHSGRTIAGGVNDDQLQSVSNEMYRALRKDILVVNFYG